MATIRPVHLFTRQESLDLPVGPDIVSSFDILLKAADQSQQDQKGEEPHERKQPRPFPLRNCNPIQHQPIHNEDDRGQTIQDHIQDLHASYVLIERLLHGAEVSFNQLVDAHVEKVGQEEQVLHVRVGAVVLPVGYGLAGHEYPAGKIVLGHAPLRAIPANLTAQLHTPATRLPWPSSAGRSLVDDHVPASSRHAQARPPSRYQPKPSPAKNSPV